MSRHFQRLVVATRNPGKLREFRSLLAPAGLEVAGLSDVSLDKECEETGLSFAENARLKASFYSREIDLPVLADDSGLEVFALGGRPGVYSARYAGAGATDAQRVERLLLELASAGCDRTARFVCALALALCGEILLESEGECNGVIADRPRGTNGFGYDPVFYFPELGRTYAELSEAEKNRYSHRARAVHDLMTNLRLTIDE